VRVPAKPDLIYRACAAQIVVFTSALILPKFPKRCCADKGGGCCGGGGCGGDGCGPTVQATHLMVLMGLCTLGIPFLLVYAVIGYVEGDGKRQEFALDVILFSFTAFFLLPVRRGAWVRMSGCL
jgi:hypothetical protein